MASWPLTGIRRNTIGTLLAKYYRDMYIYNADMGSCVMTRVRDDACEAGLDAIFAEKSCLLVICLLAPGDMTRANSLGLAVIPLPCRPAPVLGI
jgi:hypothetical protein